MVVLATAADLSGNEGEAPKWPEMMESGKQADAWPGLDCIQGSGKMLKGSVT